MRLTRKKKLIINMLSGVVKQLITVICGFILPRYMLLYYGSSVNGLVSSITHFLSFISLLDMGVGAVIQANLYKPLAQKDTAQISRIVKSSERFFRRLAYIFLAYIAVLCIGYDVIFSSEYSPLFTISLILIISVSTLAQYMFGMTYQLLLTADQRGYIQMGLQIGTVVLNTVLSIILIQAGASFHVVKLVATAVFVLKPLGQMLYVRKHYDINRKVKLIGEPIKQKWNGFSQHFAAVVCQNVAVAVLTLFSTLENISVYSVYYNVTHGINQIVMTAANGLESFFGNIIAKNEKEQLQKSFATIEWIIHNIVMLVFTIAAITIVPFIRVYTLGINDANYIAPLFGCLLVIAYAGQCLRVPYFRIIKAAGHFKQTQNGAFISAGLNIVITIALVSKLGLVGAACGTLVAMFYHTVYFAWYLRKNILNRSFKYFLEYMATDALIAVVSALLTKNIFLGSETYLSWFVMAIKVFAIVLVVLFVVNVVFYRQHVKRALGILRKFKK